MDRDKPVSGEGWSDGHPEAADDPLAVTSTVRAPLARAEHGDRYLVELALRPIAELAPDHYWYALRDQALEALDRLVRRR